MPQRRSTGRITGAGRRLRAAGCRQCGVRGVKRGRRQQLHLVGIIHRIAAIGEPPCGVIVEADRDGHGGSGLVP